ncbi:MAG: serine phosphatase RsbU (regulator of sigma subunit) [Flammeovirgaceae bacterium]|jgi:serine phosphatase RsbU (regulator of sigma subunit)/ligand-binding sensor domain-containing protein
MKSFGSSLLLLFITTAACFGQLEGEYGDFRVKNYSSEEYGAHFQNWNIAQDPRGVMYFANNTEVLEYDGKNWNSFKLGSKSLSVAISDDGTVYAGGIGQIGYLRVNDLGEKEMVSLVDKIPEAHRDFQNIWRVVATENGVFFKEKNKIFRYHNDSIQVIPAPSHAFFYSVENELFVTDSAGVNVMVDNHFELLPHTETLNSTTQSLTHVMPASDGKLLLVTRYNGLYSYDYKKVKEAGSFENTSVSSDILKKIPTVFDDYLKKYQAYCVYPINENWYGIGTLGGGIVIMEKSGKFVGIVNKSRGLIDNRIYYLYADQQQNLWAATNNGISCIYTSSPFQYFGNESGLNTGIINTIRYNEKLYTGTYNSLHYLSDYELQLEKDLHRFESIIDQPAWALRIHKENLFAGMYSGLYQVKGAETKKLYTASDVVYSLGNSNKFPNHFFLGLRSGMVVVELNYPTNSNPNSWTSLIESDADLFTEHKYNIKKITNDKNENLWVSTESNGLLYVQFPTTNLSDLKITRLDTLNGLPYNSGNVAYMYEGGILVTTNQGIYEIEEGIGDDAKIKLVPTTKFPTVPKGYTSIKHLAFGNDKIYLSSEGGLVSLDKSDAKPEWNTTPFKELTSNIETQYVDKNGIVWYSGNNELIRYNTNREKNYDSSYHTFISKVTLNSDSIIYYGNSLNSKAGNRIGDSTTYLEYQDNNVKFEYNAIFYEYSDQLVYQFFLDGFDDEFSAWTSETTKEYTNLPEGNYCFNVKAKNVFGKESTTAKYYFNIKTPWYRTWLAYALYLASIILIIYLAVRLNGKRLEKEKRNLELIVSERTAEVVTQNEELQQQAEEISTQRDHIEEQNQSLVGANASINEQKEQIEKAFSNITIVSNIGREITGSLHTKAIIRKVYEHINKLMKAEAFGIGIYNEGNQTIDFDGFIENEEEIPFSFDSLSNSNSLSVYCFLNKKDVIINDFQKEHKNYIDGLNNTAEGAIPESLIYMPLLVENKAVGVITVQSFTKNAYSEKDKTVLSTLASYVAIAISNANSYEVIEEKNENITASIRYARTIQKAVLPKLEDLQNAFADVFVLYRPKDIVSGDFYWHSQTTDSQGKKKQFIAVADCTGHGVPGAFMSMIGNTLLNEIINIKDIHDVETVLEELDTSIKVALRQKDMENNDGMDIALCCIESLDNEGATIHFSGAKRPLHLYSQDKKQLEKVKATRRGIGGFDRKMKIFERVSLTVKKGDIIYLQTDGMADQAMTNSKKIGSATIAQMIEEYAHLPLSAQNEQLNRFLDKVQGDMPQRDDITLLGFQV